MFLEGWLLPVVFWEDTIRSHWLSISIIGNCNLLYYLQTCIHFSLSLSFCPTPSSWLHLYNSFLSAHHLLIIILKIYVISTISFWHPRHLTYHIQSETVPPSCKPSLACLYRWCEALRACRAKPETAGSPSLCVAVAPGPHPSRNKAYPVPPTLQEMWWGEVRREAVLRRAHCFVMHFTLGQHWQ